MVKHKPAVEVYCALEDPGSQVWCIRDSRHAGPYFVGVGASSEGEPHRLRIKHATAREAYFELLRLRLLGYDVPSKLMERMRADVAEEIGGPDR